MPTASIAPESTPDVRLAPAIRDRWSTRAFDADHVVDRADLGLLIEAARWAASAGNSQPWAFIVGQRGDATFEATEALLSRGNKAWAGRASVLIVTLHRTAVEPGSSFPFSDYAAYDLGQAVSQLVIQAQEIGLHAHQFAGFDHEGIARRFAVPEHWAVTTGIAVGKLAPADTLEPVLADRERAPRTRHPAREIAFAGSFGQPLE